MSVQNAIIGSDNGLVPIQHQAIIWTNDGSLLIGPLGTHFSEIWMKTEIFSYKKMNLKVSSEKWHPFCHGLNVCRYGTTAAGPPTYSTWNCRINAPWLDTRSWQVFVVKQYIISIMIPVMISVDLGQDCGNSSAIKLELWQCYAKPLICGVFFESSIFWSMFYYCSRCAMCNMSY